jgi:SAM-dependent methyltransferase
MTSPWRLPAAALRRIVPGHPRLGFRWIHLPDGSITFREAGFVAAESPALLLARHNYETGYIERLLDGCTFRRSLEIGCGYGRLTPTFAKHAGEHIAVDINVQALEQAREQYPRFDFREASVTGLPFRDGWFDLVVTWTVMQHVPPDRIATACSEIRRVLDDHGMLLTCEETLYPTAVSRGAHTWHRSEDEYEQLLAPLELVHSSFIEDIDRLPTMRSPGRVMLWRARAHPPSGEYLT